MASVGLTAVGAIVGSITLNPIIIGVVSGSGVMIQGYLSKSDIAKKVDQCKFANTSYDKLLIQLRGYMRGMPCDDVVFLSDMGVLDGIDEDFCPPVGGKIADRYKKNYEIIKKSE